MQNIVIIGASGHAGVIIDSVERQARYRIAGIIDAVEARGVLIHGYTVLGGDSELAQVCQTHAVSGAIVAIGDNYLRAQVAERSLHSVPALEFVCAVHPSASIGRGVELGAGTVVMAGACINSNARVGRHCIINTQACVEHDSVLSDCASLAPQAVIGGNCDIGAYSAISIGATLVHGIGMGEHSVVGAGSLVLKDVPAQVVVYGMPATVQRRREVGEGYL